MIFSFGSNRASRLYSSLRSGAKRRERRRSLNRMCHRRERHGELLETRTLLAADLGPTLIGGRPSPIVISTMPDTANDASRITSNDQVYIDVGWENFGDATTGVYDAQIKLVEANGDATTVDLTRGPDAASFQNLDDDINFGQLSVGIHRITVTLDVNGVVTEGDETNNVFLRDFEVKDPTAPEFDWGDAPSAAQSGLAASYPVGQADNGAVHRILTGFSLGTDIDGELEGLGNATATVDDTLGTGDDEDSLTLPLYGLPVDVTPTVDIFVTNTGGVAATPYVDAWIDFNQDGDWDDLGEHVISGAASAGSNTYSVRVPADALEGDTFARIRLHDGAGSIAHSGYVAGAEDGEVEDHVVTIVPTALWREQGGAPIQNGQIKNVSPNNQVNGAIESLLTHPTNPDIIYVGGVNGGIWKTTDATAVNPTWVPQIDQQESLSISAMAFDLSVGSSNTLVAGTGGVSSYLRASGPEGIVYRTTDGGNTWTKVAGAGLSGNRISGIAARGNVIVVAASQGPGGIYRSTDTGATFSAVTVGTLSAAHDFFDLVVDESDPTGMRLFAAAEDDGIYRSNDFGSTWTKISTSSATFDSFFTSNNDETEMAVHPTTGRLFVTVLTDGQPAAIFYSDDPSSGAPGWMQMDVPILPLTGGTAIESVSNTSPIVVTSTGHGLSDGDFVVIAGVTGGSAPNNLFRIDNVTADTFELAGSVADGPYTDDTGTWTHVTSANPRYKPGGQGAIHFSITLDPTNDDIVYVGGDRQEHPSPIGDSSFNGAIFRGDVTVGRDSTVAPSPQWDHITHQQTFTSDDGTANDSAPHADSREMAFDANGNLIEVDDGGIYRRTNPGDNSGDWFSLVGNLGVTEYHNIAYDELTHTVFGGTQDNGTQGQTAEGDLTWTFLQGGDGGDVAVDNISLAGSNQSIRYMSSQNLGGLRRRTYDANNNQVTSAAVGLNETDGTTLTAQFYTPLAVNAVDGHRLLIGSGSGIYESTNQGDDITRVSTSVVPAFVGNAIDYGGRSGGVDNLGVFYAATSSGNVLIRQFSASAVNSTATGLSGEVRGVRMDPDEWQTAVAVDTNDVVITFDAGGVWNDITGNLTSLVSSAFRSVEYIPGIVDALDAIVVGTGAGVYATLAYDIGNWFSLGDDLPNVQVRDMVYSEPDDALVVGTLGRGAWVMPFARQAIAAFEAAPTVYLNEVVNDAPGTGGDDDYIEVRGTANDNLYRVFAVVADGDVGDNPGEITQVIDLGGPAPTLPTDGYVSLGSNGFAAVTEAGNTYSVNAGSTEITAAIASEDGSSTTFLVYAATLATDPTVGFDLDVDDNGLDLLPDDWFVLDGVSVLDGDDASDIGYADIVFTSDLTGVTEAGATVVSADFGATDSIQHVMRLGDSTGSDVTDWVAFELDVTEPDFTITQTTRYGYDFGSPGDIITDHVGATNPEPALGVTVLADDVIADFSTDTLLVSEDGATVELAFALNTVPTDDVVITLTPTDSEIDLGAGAGAAVMLTFTAADALDLQTVTVSAIDDLLVENPHPDSMITIDVSSAADASYDAVTINAATVEITDNDFPGVTVTGGAADITESGMNTFTVVLDSQPQAEDVIITIDVDDATEAEVDMTTLTFTNADWDQPQTVTISGKNDDIQDGTQPVVITVSVDQGMPLDGDYAESFMGEFDQTISFNVLDENVNLINVTTPATTALDETGTTTTFDVTLNTIPVSDVVLSVSSSDAGEIVISDDNETLVGSATLTFTSLNWDQPQTVTLTGEDDPLVDGLQMATITISVDDASSSDEYDPVGDQTIMATNADDEVAGITVSTMTLTLAEGATDTFTVVLDEQPVDDVVLDVTSAATDNATVDMAQLTFTNADWFMPQTVTVTGVAEDVDDDNVAFNTTTTDITISVNAAGSHDVYETATDQTVSVTVTDDDTAAVSVTLDSGEDVLSGDPLAETGTTSVLSVVLESEPVSNVVITITSSDDTEVLVTDADETLVSVATLTFTVSNWDTPQLVTLTGQDDTLADGLQAVDITVGVDAMNSSDEYDSVSDFVINTANTDDEVPGISVTPTVLMLAEGATDTFDVVLDAQPVDDVVLTVISDDTGTATVDIATLTFTTADWNQPQTVTVTGVEEDIDDGDMTATITIAVDAASSHDIYDPVSSQTVAVTVSDDDTNGFSIVESAGSTAVTESGAGNTDTFTVALDTEPLSDVVLTVTSGNVNEAGVDMATLTFNSMNWNQPQTVTVTGQDDFVEDGDQMLIITVSVDDAASNDAFDPLADQTVNVTVSDVDTNGISLNVLDGLALSETGTTSTVEVTLATIPAGDVVLTISSDDDGEVSVSQTTLTFTPANWNMVQTFVMTGEDDDATDGQQTAMITVAVDDAMSSNEYDGLSESLTVTNDDDELAGFTITESAGTTSVGESSGTDTFDVVLNERPVTDVVLTVTSGDTGSASVDVSTLTFTSADWNTPQTVTVTGVVEGVDDGDVTFDVTIAVDVGMSDSGYATVASQTVAVTVIDDDPGAIIVTPLGGLSLSEDGTTSDVEVTLTSQPVTDVVLNVSSSTRTEVSVNTSTLTFTPANWNQPQTFQMAGEDDLILDGPQNVTVTVSVDAGMSSSEYGAVPTEMLSVTNADNEVAGFTVIPTAFAVSESASDTFDVVLDAQPQTDVVLTVTSGDTSSATVDLSTLTFTPADWNTPQTVTVSGVIEDIDDGNSIIDITVAVDVAMSDNGFSTAASQTVAVTANNDDTAGISLTPVGGVSLSEDGTTSDVEVMLTSEPVTDVVLTISSGTPSEVSVDTSTLTFTPANWNQPQTFQMTGEDDSLLDGPQNVTVTVSVDAGMSSAEYAIASDETLSVTNADNEIASFTVAPASLSISEGQSDTFDVVLDTQPQTDVMLTVTSADTNNATIDLPTLTFTSTDWNMPQTVTATGVVEDVDDGAVTTDITIAVDVAMSDNGFSTAAAQAVAVTVSDDDTAGITVTPLGSLSLSEDGTTSDVEVVLTSQPVTDVVVTISSDATSEVSVNTPTLTFTPANWSAPQTFRMTGQDDAVLDGPQNATVTVSVDAGMSSSEYGSIPNETLNVSNADNEVADFIIQSDGTNIVFEDGTTDTFTVVLQDQPLSDVTLSITSTDTGEASVDQSALTFTPANWDQPQTVTVSGVDELTVDGDQVIPIRVAVVTAASHALFHTLSPRDINFTITDNDVPSFSVTQPMDGSFPTTTVSESRTSDTLCVVLGAQPETDVFFTVTISDPTEATLNTMQLRFTFSNWDQPQQIVVTGVDEPVVDGDQTSTLTVSVNSALTNDFFDGLAPLMFDVTTLDNDNGRFLVSSLASSIVSESGTTQSFQVVLAAQPLSNVVLDVVSSDTTEATIDTPALTFTPSDWNIPQSITISGTDDDIVDGTQLSTITVSVDAALSGDGFDSALPSSLTISTTDNDIAGFTVTESSGSTSVSESGTMDSLTVVLDAEPLTDVVFAISASDSEEATVDADTLTFTPDNWDQPQTVTVTGVDDAVVDGTTMSTITIAVNDTASALAFRSLSDATVSVATLDDEVPGFTVTESSGSSEVSESGSTDTLTVVLDAQPQTDVVLSVTSADPDDVSATPTSLTFTPQNWNVSQSVSLTGQDDGVVNGDRNVDVTVSVNAAQSDAAFGTLASQAVTVLLTDDDVAGFMIDAPAGGLEVIETGTADTFTVVLTAQPLTDVVLDVSSDDLGEASVSPGQLTFTPETWNTPQSVTATGEDDTDDDGDQMSQISVAINVVASDALFAAVAQQMVPITTFDDEGITLTVVLQGATDLAVGADAMGNVQLSLTGDGLADVTARINGIDTSGPFPASELKQLTVIGSDESNLIDLGDVSDADFTFVTGVSVIVNAGDGSDLVTGSEFGDSLTGAGGNDVIFGRSGDDTLRGGAGKDALDGGSGNDALFGQGATGDSLTGGAGDDILNGGSGNDVIIESALGNLTLTTTTMTGLGSDSVANLERAIILGSPGPDRLDVSGFFVPGFSSTKLFGGDGDDTLIGSKGNDLLRGEGGSDSLVAGHGDDRVYGGSGADTLLGGNGNDRLFGQGGSGDILGGGSGIDLLNGGNGIDRVFGQADVDFVLTDSQLDGNGLDSLMAIETATLIGGPSDNVIDTSGFSAAKLSVVVDAGAGNDTVIGSQTFNRLSGGDGDDTLLGGPLADKLMGKAGNDLLQGGDGNDDLKGGNNNDTLLGEEGDDTLDGGRGADGLSGAGGNDVLNGWKGSDIVLGGQGNDTLEGFDGSDTLIGGVGLDMLAGQGGTDILVRGDGTTAEPADPTDNPAEVDDFFMLSPFPAWIDEI